ncbi:PilN domain-containing protein [Gilliamella intestini]|uniref:Fimbrial assembly protein (PilN) n=1 Tax=Gilliamella intestini TaxID=1798183 RepID=A0A1C3ZFR5_9GAMM|nr:PilN domain-containing protein [Gilliamella intestini]SCB81239.1 Fimbrial assembly protein (PilN) [Gilliamella intestini]
MVFNKERVIIYVQPAILRYKAVSSAKQITTLDTSDGLIAFHYQNEADIDLFLSDLQKKFAGRTEFELNLDANLIQMQQLDLPDIKLELSELILYVEANIYKLFQLSAKNVFFDFVYPSKPNKYVTVMITERNNIENWVNLFKKYELPLTFVGCRVDHAKINFLPWRQEKQIKHRRQLAYTIVSLIGVISCLLCYWWIQARNEQQYYEQKLLEQQQEAQKLTAELSTYLPTPSLSQKQIQDALLLFSAQLPSVIWLDSFYYEQQKITIDGQSFSYVELTNFNQNLLTLKNISNSQINSVLSNKTNLFFEMEIRLNEQ